MISHRFQLSCIQITLKLNCADRRSVTKASNSLNLACSDCIFELRMINVFLFVSISDLKLLKS